MDRGVGQGRHGPREASRLHADRRREQGKQAHPGFRQGKEPVGIR